MLAGPDPSPAPPTYYLALGDSLSRGVQPDAAGASVETQDGYPNQVYAALRPSHPTLKLVKLGCPGETTSTMINGGICHYDGGSQLQAAVAFLQAHLVAWAAERLAATYNDLLDRVYTTSGARVANVFGAFDTADFAVQGTAPGAVPRNVALLCQWTWACAAPPRGPNQHANSAGYQVIARVFLQASGLH